MRCLGCMKEKKQSPVCEHCGFDENRQNQPHQLPVGTILKDQYLIGRVLGQGGFGITYLGWDLYLDTPIAIKEYYPAGSVMRECTTSLEVKNYSNDSGSEFRDDRQRFMNEAKALARFCNVPQIVQVRNFFPANNTAYIIMEYVEGVTLKDFVRKKGALSLDQALKLLVPVMNALEKIHQSGIIHRDISPDNIMLTFYGGAKLLDFGAVRDVRGVTPNGQLTQSTVAILKQGFAPMEQYQTRGALGPWTDVYAMTATLIYCLTGNIPPEAPDRLMGDDLQLEQMLPALTAAQRGAIAHGFASRTDQRTASMEALVKELTQKIQEQPVQEQPVDLEATARVRRPTSGARVAPVQPVASKERVAPMQQVDSEAVTGTLKPDQVKQAARVRVVQASDESKSNHAVKAAQQSGEDIQPIDPDATVRVRHADRLAQISAANKSAVVERKEQKTPMGGLWGILVAILVLAAFVLCSLYLFE